MSTKTSLSTADHITHLAESMAQVRTSPDASLRVPAQLSEMLADQGLRADVYSVAFAGQTGPNTRNVQVNAANHGYSSDWPGWAFELAKAALLANKQVWVASNGDPFGSNLVFVMIMS